MSQRFSSFAEFYPFYLKEHSNINCRRMHFFGTFLVISLIFVFLTTGNWKLLLFTPIFGYGFAWFGHFYFEKNKPATFPHPLYSLIADFVMFRDILLGKVKI